MKINKKLLMAALASAVIVSAPQVKTYTLSNAESVATNTELGLSQQKPQAAVRAEGNETKQSTDPNYSEDEKKIKDYNGSERYKTTDLQPGDTNQELGKTDEKVEKDGFKFELKNPSNTSPSKTEYGYEIVIDKKTGQRTYTKIYVTDSGLIPLDKGNKPMMGQGEKLTPESPDVTYKPGENAIIDGAGKQRNLNYDASEETLKHLNNKDNDFTSLGFKDNYTADNPRVKFFGGSFILGYKVNPWPNENDKLELLKLNGQYDKKVFVQGQDIDTGIKVDNIDENAKERLVGQVYNPITGKIVPGASAYIGDNGNIHVKLPDGALKKDENGKTVINEDSIFNTPDFKALQNLDVKFFARPRTAEEFKTIAETPDEFGETGTYTGSGAGTADINHKGTNVKIDKQGIDRYDHYNLIGGFKLNLDDTRYYDQRFVDGNGDDTSKVTSSAVKPGKPFKVGIVQPENPSDTDKSADDMNGAQDRGEASGRLIMDFINRENKGKAPEDQWKVDVNPKDISNFTITAPKSAKAGDFVAIPVEYTYTNGSKDTHWFHFVVQESTYIKPEYDAQVNYPINKQTSPATWTEDGKRIPPSRFTLPDTLETDEAGNKLIKDDKGNDWTVTLDETTGEVTAKPVNPDDFDGGEKLTVPVIAHYVDKQKPGEDITEEVNAYFVIEEKANMTPRYNAKAGKEGDTLTSDVILNEEDRYNRRPGKYTIDSPTYTDDKGNVWNVSIDEKTGTVTATVPNAEEGKTVDGALLNVPVTAHYYEEDEEGNIVEAGTKQTEVQFVAYGTNGTKIHTEQIPFEYDIQYDPDFYKNYPDAKGNYKVVTEGVPGEKTTTWTIKDSKIVGEPKVETKDPVNAVIKVGQKDYTGTITHTEKVETPFKVEYRYNPDLEAGQTKRVQEGKDGSYTLNYSQNIKNGQADGDPTTSKTDEVAAQNEIIEIGTKPVTKVVEKPFNTEYVFDENLESGKTEEIKPGKNGKVTITTTYDKDQKKVVTSETEEKGQNRVVKIGGKTNGTEKIKEEIPFEVEVRKDPSLKKGEWKYATDDEGNELRGEKGEQERTLTIENSKVTNTSEPTVTKKAKNAVILVGEGTNDGDHKIVEKKELPFETRYEYDDSLEPGEEKVVQEGKPGLQERTNTLVIKDGKVTEVKEGEFKTITEPEERIVKIGRKPTEGEVTKTIEREIPYETKVIYDETLEAGFQKIENEGKPGKEEVTITQKVKDSKPVGDPTETTKTITEKEDRVVRIGVKPVVKEVELGHDTEYRHNPELKEGETKVIEEGSNGSVKYTTTFNKETGKLEVKEERTEPKNKVVEYGSKTDGEFTYESEKAYDIIIRENPNLEAGKTKVIQEGIVGKTETTVKIENSKEVSRDTKTITEKQDKIIEIGTKNVCEIPPVNPDPEKPGKPGDKDPEKPGKPGDKDPEKPDKPGDKDPEKPGKPDEDPKDPEQPGEDPKDPEQPGKPGDKKPGKPGEEKPGKPGDKDPEKPGKPGEEKPGKPGDKDPENPDKPGDKDPETPGKPGDKDPENPDKPGDKNPKDPDKPGEDPKDPGKDPGKTPEENGKTPENNGKTPENNGKTPENNGKTPGATGQVDGKSTTTNNKTPKRLPKSGSESEIMTLAMSGLLAAAGFIGLKKKRKDQ
ncbi:G5 domain-containing protein [Finegoldia dalianensis]|uniref:G5 domain-containing protein n=1 Tax=Finegoldia dalianensis TaxID=3145239 RepID=A0ABW9KB12_9FIRM